MHILSKYSNRTASVVAVVIGLAWERRRSSQDCSSAVGRQRQAQYVYLGLFQPHRPTFFVPSITACESNKLVTDENLSTPSLLRKTLASLGIRNLPLPRRLVPNDPVFQGASLKRGLRQRKRDERALRKLQSRVVEAMNAGEGIRELHHQTCEIAFGKGVTPQLREDFVIRYGCTGWTDQVLDTLVDLAEGRGFVEIGAGQGQWARALTARHDEVGFLPRNKVFDFVLAFDDMSELPLSPEIYHEHTQPAHDYFYSRVQKCTDANSVLRQWTCRGRVLLMVYPPPGSMAVEAIKSYAELGPENDTVVYVGEGRGGANANDDFFSYVESGDWAVLSVLPVRPPPGGKGYEQLHVMQRIKRVHTD